MAVNVPQPQTPALLPGRAHAELQTAAHAINDHHRQVEESLRAGFNNALTHAIEAGRKLTYAKSLVAHGEWGPWVDRHLTGIDARTERLYRQLAEAVDDGRLQIGNGLPISSIRKARELLIQSGDCTSTPVNGEDGGHDSHTPSAPTGESEGNESRSHTPSVCRIARQVLAPLREVLAENSEVEYEQLVEELADQLEGRSSAREWARAIEGLFADVGAELEERGYQ